MRVVVLLLALVALLVTVEGATFRQVIDTSGKWSPRQKANVEFVKKTTDFRDGIQQKAVRLTNYFLLYGGESNRGPQNDVWASTNGITWVWVAGVSDGEDHYSYAETFTPSGEASHCQDSSYRQYRVGGHQGGVILSEVWMSVDGFRWTPQTVDAEFTPVYLANMVGDTQGNIYIAGGIIDYHGTRNPRRSTGDVWMSRNQGKTWTQQHYGRNQETNLPSGPGERAVSILLNAQTNTLIWLTGVNSGLGVNDPAESYQKDVWVSTNQGRNFHPVNLQTPFGRRDDSNAEITDAGLIVLAGGYSGTGQGLETTGEIYNDIWVSPNGGYTWGLCVQNAEWEDRRYQMTLLDGEGYMWVMGGASGENNGANLDDMWKSLWSFNDVAKTATQCRITVPSCGAGLKCLPNSGNTLVASDGSGVYCDSCPYTFSGQNAAQTVVVAFLVVFIILFIITVLALIYTYHKLRSAGAPSPIPLPATAQRWWNKSTTGGAIGTSDAGNTANGDGLYQPLRIRDQV